MSKETPILQDRVNDLSKVRKYTPRGPLVVILIVLAVAIAAAWIFTARETAYTRAAWREQPTASA